MRHFISICVLIVFMLSCRNSTTLNNSNTQNTDSLRGELLKVDKSWNDHSLKVGYHRSRIDFADSAAIDLLEGEMPLHGIKEIEHYAASHPDSFFTLSWQPLQAEVATSGDLGYTFGGWVMKAKTQLGEDTTLYGDYMTVWKKQPDGSWKYVVEGGNNTPKQIER